MIQCVQVSTRLCTEVTSEFVKNNLARILHSQNHVVKTNNKSYSKIRTEVLFFAKAHYARLNFAVSLGEKKMPMTREIRLETEPGQKMPQAVKEIRQAQL